MSASGAASSSLSLYDIVRSFNAPIEEDHAWAICYQCVQQFKLSSVSMEDKENESFDGEKPESDQSLSNNFDQKLLKLVYIDSSGHVHMDFSSIKRDFWSFLGLVMFQALDYGLENCEQQLLSDDLEQLISKMIDKQESITVANVVEMCCKRLSTGTKVDSHYQSICKVLIAETLHLKAYLKRTENRVLGKLPQQRLTPREHLLESIRMRPLLTRKAKFITKNLNTEPTTPERKLIKPERNLLQSFSDDDGGEDDDNFVTTRQRITAPTLSPLSPLSPTKDQAQLSNNISLDLNNDGDCDDVSNCSFIDGVSELDNSNYSDLRKADRRQSIKLSVKEICHIRSVFCKAELENLFSNSELYENVSKGKVCFLCKNTKFSIVNPSSVCEFCQQKVCSHCCCRMQVSMTEVHKVPVQSISPVDRGERRAQPLMPIDLNVAMEAGGNSKSSAAKQVCSECHSLLDHAASSSSTLGRYPFTNDLGIRAYN